METILLAIQARVLLAIGLLYIGVGLWMGTDPATLAWRAPLAALLGMTGAGWLLRQVAQVIEERMSADMAERQLAAEQAAANATPAGIKALQAGHEAQNRLAQQHAGRNR